MYIASEGFEKKRFNSFLNLPFSQHLVNELIGSIWSFYGGRYFAKLLLERSLEGERLERAGWRRGQIRRKHLGVRFRCRRRVDLVVRL